MLVKTIRPEKVIRDLKEMKRILGKKEVIVFGSLIKGVAIEKESDIDVAVKGKLSEKERNLIYDIFSKKLYEKYKAILVLHEIHEKEWKSFLKKIGKYVSL